MYLSAPVLAERHVARIVQISGDTEELALASLVESARHKATDFIKLLLPTFAIYWFVAGLGGRTPLLKARHANALLIAGSSGVIAIAASSYFYWAETYCDQLPYPHKGFQILRINECPSSQIFFSSLFWISAAFFLASLMPEGHTFCNLNDHRGKPPVISQYPTRDAVDCWFHTVFLEVRTMI